MAEDLEDALGRVRVREKLREARVRARLTQPDVAGALRWSVSKVLRIEQGQVGLAYTDAQALVALYGIDATEAAEILTLAEKGGRGRSGKHVSPQLLVLMNHERSAKVVRQFELSIVPGLLQIPDYAYTVIRCLSHTEESEAEVKARVRIRQQRQRLQFARRDVRMRFLLDEAVLRRPVGGPALMRRQHEHLRQMAQRPNISIQVLSFELGAHPGMKGAFTVMEFDDPTAPGLLYVESARDDAVVLDAPEEAQRFTTVFDELATKAGALDDFLDNLST